MIKCYFHECTKAISYTDEHGKTSGIVPWRPLPLVASHKTAEVIIQLESLVKPMGMTTKSIGRFTVKDVLGNTSKSGETYYNISDRQSFFPSEREYYEWIMTYERELPPKELTQAVDNSESKSLNGLNKPSNGQASHRSLPVIIKKRTNTQNNRRPNKPRFIPSSVLNTLRRR